MMKVFWLGLFMVCGGLAIRWLDRQAEADRVSGRWLKDRTRYEGWTKQLTEGPGWRWPIRRD